MTFLFVVFSALSLGIVAQIVPSAPKAAGKADEKKQPRVSGKNSKDGTKPVTAEQVVESSLLVYAFPGGREKLNQIRKTAFERGKVSTTNAEGKVERATYQRWTLRGATRDKEKIRLDQEFPDARYALIYTDDKIIGVYNNAIFTPRDDAARAFQNQITFGIESLLRYKEFESKIEYAGREKQLGVEYYLIDLTDKQQRKARFYVSVKTFRVMAIEFEDAGVKYRRRFYNYNYAQGTLVPYRSVLYANDKMVEETEVGTVTFGQKIDETMFSIG